MQIKNKRAQLGETMTWIVATIAIIAILLISVYVSSALATKGEILGRNFEKCELGVCKRTDLLAVKSLTAYLNTQINEDVVHTQLSRGDINEGNKKLAKDIFENNFVIKDYNFEGLGLTDSSGDIQSNIIGDVSSEGFESIFPTIKLNSEKNLQIEFEEK